MLVKKLILALFLSVGICAVGVQTDVYASEPTVQEDGAAGNDGEIRKEYVDLSDSVIQEGGFPKAESTSTLAMTKGGEIIVDERCRTSVKGVYAAGDVTNVPYKQVIVAMGEGAKAALSHFEDAMRGDLA